MTARDSELLARYLDTKDESAFSQLVEVYGGMVLAAARSVTGDNHAAREAAQNTFITLVRKAPSLRGRESLGGWLHHTAMLSARNLVRNQRREEKKRLLLEASIDVSSPDADDAWESMRPVLDESLESLPEKDRDAVVLRFYRGCSVQEVASALQVTLAAAQKRLGRALERLRIDFQRRGVTLSVPALTSGLGLWMGKSQCAAASCVAWTGKALATASNKVGSSTTIGLFLTIMTKSKITTAIVVAALLFGAIALHQSKQRPDEESPSSSSAAANRPSRTAPRGGSSESAKRLRELEAKFGSERVRQARRIVALLHDGVAADTELALKDLDRRTAQWVAQRGATWDLDESQVEALTQLIGKEQDERIRKFKEGVYQLAEGRTVSSVEAILLADQAARGELTREEFEGAYHRLSEIRSFSELEVKMISAFSLEAYLLDEELASAMVDLVPPDRQARIRQQMDGNSKKTVDSQIALLKHQVPDLSEEQIGQLRAYVRKVGRFFPRRSFVADFLTPAQNEAWRVEEEREPGKASGFVRTFTIGEDGSPVVVDAFRTRSVENGEVPAYPWTTPMTLEEAEREARKLSQGKPGSPNWVISESLRRLMEPDAR